MAIRQDNANNAFVMRELESLKSTVFEVKYEALKARDLFPTDGETDEGAESIRYEVMDLIGVAKLIASYSDDIPRADTITDERISPVKPLATSFAWNIDEIASARMSGRNLGERKSRAAVRAAEQIIHNIAMRGDATTGLPGFLTNPNIPLISAADIGGGVTEWASKTGDQVLTDLNALANGPSDTTNGVEFADTMILPVAQYNRIATLRLPDSDETVLSYFLKTNPYIKAVEWVPDLATSATGSAPLAAVYRRSAEVLSLEIPKEPDFLPPQERGLEIVTIVHGKVGGVIVYYPLACQFMDSI